MLAGGNRWVAGQRIEVSGDTALRFVPRSALRLLTPEENAGTCLFNKHAIRHRFCPTCGIHPYGEGTSPAGETMAAVNLRCIEGIDLDAIPVNRFDGRSL